MDISSINLRSQPQTSHSLTSTSQKNSNSNTPQGFDKLVRLLLGNIFTNKNKSPSQQQLKLSNDIAKKTTSNPIAQQIMVDLLSGQAPEKLNEYLSNSAPLINTHWADQITRKLIETKGFSGSITLKGSNIEKGATITVRSNNEITEYQDGGSGDLDGKRNGIITTASISAYGDITISVDNNRAPDFNLKINTKNIQLVKSVETGDQDALSHAPNVSIQNNDKALQLTANFSQNQISLFKKITNGNLIGNSGSSPSDPNNRLFEQQLLSGSVNPEAVSDLLNNVEETRKDAIQSVNERLYDVVNNIRELDTVYFQKPRSNDSSTLASEKLFDGLQQIRSAWNNLQSVFGDLNNALQKARDLGVSDDYLAAGLNAIKFNGQTGSEAIVHMESIIQSSVDTFLNKATQLMKSGDELITNIEDYEEKKRTLDALETAMSFITLATSGAGMARGLFKGIRSFMKVSRQTKQLKEAANLSQRAADDANKKLQNAIKQSNIVNIGVGSGGIKPKPTVRESLRERALTAQKIAGDAQVKLSDSQKARSKARNALIDASIKPVDWSATATRTMSSTMNKYQLNPSEANKELSEQVSHFMSTGDSSALRKSDSFKRFQNTFTDLFIKYAWKTGNYSRIPENENNNQRTIFVEQSATDNETSTQYQKIKWEMVSQAKELNKNSNGVYYYVKDDKEEYLFHNKYILTINKIDIGTYLPITHKNVLIKGHNDTDQRRIPSGLPELKHIK